MQFLSSLWLTTSSLAPSLLLGLVVAGVLHVYVKRERILRHLGAPGIRSSTMAALAGVPLPLCSCGVLPSALSLKRDGASDGAVTSFLISTPQTGVDSIAITWGMLGLPVALAKLITAFAAGVAGGTIADRKGRTTAAGGSAAACEPEGSGPAAARIWRYSVGTIFRDIYGWIAMGIVISALITVTVEPGELSRYAFLSGPAGLLGALAVGIPLYVCSVASVPIAAALIYAGFPVGSALVFLMAGPATNAATMGAVRKSLGSRVFWIYILTVVAASFAAGLLLNNLSVPVAGIGAPDGSPANAWTVVVLVSSVSICIGILWFGFTDIFRLIGRGFRKSSGKEGSVRLRIDGMSCAMCEKRVREVLSGSGSISVHRVSAGDGIADISLGPGGREQLEKAVKELEDMGYKVPGIPG